MRKNQGLLKKLSTEQQAQLERWLFDETPAVTYPQAQERLQREFNVHVSEGSLSAFYQRHGQERILSRMVETGQAGNAHWGPLGRKPEQPFNSLLEVVGRAAFDIPARGGEPLTLAELKDLAGLAALGMKTYTEVAKLRIREHDSAVKEREVEIKDRDVALRETKYQDLLAKENLEPEEGGLSDETIEKIRDAVGLM